MKTSASFLIILLVKFGLAQAQPNPMIDSLRNVLRITNSDTARIGLYIEMAYAAEDSTVVLFSDSAVASINALLPDAERSNKAAIHRYFAEALYVRSMFFANSEAYDTALHYLNRAMEHALAARDRRQEARALNDMGVCYFRKNEVIKSVDHFTRSLVIREQLNDDEQLYSAYNNVAFIYKETGLIDRSLELNFKALALAEKRKNDREIALSFNNIGQLYHKYLVDNTRALEYYKKGLAIWEKVGDKRGRSLLKNNIGALSAEMGNYRESIQSYHESLLLRRKINYKFGMANTLSSLSYNYIKTGNFDSARASLKEALQINEGLRDKVLNTSIHRNYAELFISLEKPDSALLHANHAHALNLESGNPLSISSSAVMLSGLYEKLGDNKQALGYYKLFKKMQDSISNNDLQKQGVRSNIEYEYLKKKSESDKLHGEQLARKNLYTWLLIVLFAASVLLGYVLYKRYRLQQQLKQVEIRNKIAADLHDDVGSTLSSIRMYSDIVKQQPNQTVTSVQLLDKISTNSKETIENMSDIVWMIKPGNDEFANIGDRMLNFANELCTPAGISFGFSKNEMLSGVKIPMEQRRDVYLIFKEAINNAVKYSGCRSISASLQLDKKTLRMEITDDGNGFDTANSRNGNGLANMKKRALVHHGDCLIQSRPGIGTGIQVFFQL